MDKKYICSICGKGYNDLALYMDCVDTCGRELEKKLKKEKEEAAKREAEAKKRAEEINAAINEIEKAEVYFYKLLNEFKEKYPEEYEENFGDEYDDEDDDYCYGYDNFDAYENDSNWNEGSYVRCKEENCECRIGHDCKGNGNCDDKKDNHSKSIEFSYKNNGKDEPKLSAKVNGENVDDDHIQELFADPEVRHLARLLGIPGV